MENKLKKARLELRRAEHRVWLLEMTSHFRGLTDEQCQTKKLCMTSADGGRLRCGRPAYAIRHGVKGRIIYACLDCYRMTPEVNMDWTYLEN